MRLARHIPLTGAAALAVVTLLAGCSGGSSGTSTPAAATKPPTSPAAASTPAATPAPATTKAGHAPTAPDPNATESNPPGDIPDNQVFVPYTAPGASFSVKVPEGWARSATAGKITFTDKLNGITIETAAAASAPTVASARTRELPAIAASAPKYAARTITMVNRKGGRGVLITYLVDSPPDPVTNKVVRDAVERYEFWRGGREAILTLTGPKNADNVDPWRIVSDSVSWK